MTECDAFNLIDEFIKQQYSPIHKHECGKDSLALTITTQSNCSNYFFKSSKSPETGLFTGSSRNTSNRTSGSESVYEHDFKKGDSPNDSLKVYNEELTTIITENSTPLDQIYVNLNMSKTYNETNIYMTPPDSATKFTREEITETMTLTQTAIVPENEIAEQVMTQQKPKRPYSYYVATNFHPLDLTPPTIDETSVVNQTIPEKSETPIKRRPRKNLKQNKLETAKKRLSTSLGDMQVLNNEIYKAVNGTLGVEKNKSSSQHHLESQVKLLK